MPTIDITDSQEIYSVGQLNRDVRLLLEGHFSSLWVQGELSNFVAPQSGHWYFSLKDATAQVRCAMFRPQNRRLDFLPRDGMHLIIKARVSLYEGRGDFQLLIEQMEEAGEGKLRQAFEALKKRLAGAGLFDASHKKPLPHLPRCIGVVTSPTGAAIRDILNILKRRYPVAPVIIYPSLVQGDLAAPTIVKAIQLANQRNECDILIVARGGGSLEDLWPFNHEEVAYAIYHSNIPIVSGIGHEIDTTIADFVADLRAPTPSAAAELMTPDSQALLALLDTHEKQLVRHIKQTIAAQQQWLSGSQKQLYQQHPKRRLAEQTQQLDFCEISLVRLMQKKLTDLKTRLHHANMELCHLQPIHRIREWQHSLRLSDQRLQHHMGQSIHTKQQFIRQLAAQLDALSPLATLKRGFAIATLDNTVLFRSSQIKAGDCIGVRLQDGRLQCLVNAVEEANG